jgi:HK97 family phage major capsid protein
MMSSKQNPLRGKLAQVNEQISEKDSEVKSLWTEFEQCRDQFAQAGNDANATDSDEFKKAEEVHRRYASAAADLKGLEQVRNGVFEMLAIQGEGTMARPESQKQGEFKSLSERALESPEYKGLKDSGALNSDKRSFVATLAEMSNNEVKALITGLSDTSAGAFIVNQRQGYVEQPKRPATILNLITLGETNVDALEYARQTTFTNVAVETAEATSTTTGTKPEATIAFEKVTETVKTIAHWVPATRRALDDESQLRTIIESQLRYGLEFRLEGQVVNGDATGENLRGINNVSGVLTQAKGADTTADAVHKAITQIRLGFIEPNGIAMHPNDWQDVRLLRDGGGSVAGSGAYLYGPPSERGATTMWGLNTVVSAAVTEGTGLVGDYTKAILWLREGAQVLATDSHSDFFVKNLVAVLAELRAAFGVVMPQAFCKVTGI